MENTNEMQVTFDSRSSNEAFARVTVAGVYDFFKSHRRRSVGCEDCRVGGGDKCNHSWL